MRKPITLKQALLQTLAIHQAVLDGEYNIYSRAKDAMAYNGVCPLCTYGSYRSMRSTNIIKNRCAYCPWSKIQGLNPDGVPCTIWNGNIDYDDSHQSVKRINAWLQGKPFIPK